MQTEFNQTVIDGYSGFIFQNRNGDMRKPEQINKVINKITADYNAEETDQAKMDVYNEVTKGQKKTSSANLEGKIMIG